MWTPETPLTVGDLRKAMEGLPDDAQAFVDGHPDRPLVGAICSQQIPWSNDDWQKGDPLVVGLELWLGGDDEFPAPRCLHTDQSAEKWDEGYEACAADTEARSAPPGPNGPVDPTRNPYTATTKD